MEENKHFENSRNIIKELISEGRISKAKHGSVNFFMKKASESIAVSSRLLKLEDEEELATSMWVINTSYYAMFFAATALLAKYNHQIKTDAGIHKLTYHAIVYYFVFDDNKLEKHFIEQYKDAVEEAEELLQLSEKKTSTMISDLNNELVKRKRFTYDLGEIAEKKKAKTSFERAKSFVKEIELMLK